MKKTLGISSLVIGMIVVLTMNLAGEETPLTGKKNKAEQSESATREKKSDGQTKVRPAAVKRTRETVLMLDDIYKQTIVLITDKYVNDETDFPAGSAAVELFKRVGKSGYHQVRLIDATGEPYEPANVAETDFEKEGIKQLKAGKSSYDQVVVKDGKPYLQAMTAVPLVMQKCVMCHAHYADVKKGAPIGAISYELPIK